MWSESQQVRPWVLLHALRVRRYILSRLLLMLLELELDTATGQVYFTQAGVTTGPTTKIFDVDIQCRRNCSFRTIISDCIGRERRYTCCWNRKCAGLAATHVNFMITGDKEA